MGTKNSKTWSGSGAMGQPKGPAASCKKPASGVHGQRLASNGGGKGTTKTVAERKGY